MASIAGSSWEPVVEMAMDEEFGILCRFQIQQTSAVDRLAPRTMVPGDRTYGGNNIRGPIKQHVAVTNIRARPNRKWQLHFSKILYHEPKLPQP